MKEFDIRLPTRLTECKVLIYSLPYYSGLTVIDGFIIDSAVDGYTLQKTFSAQPGLVLASEVEGTFKLVHEAIQSELVLDSHMDLEALYKIIPEPSGIVLLEEPARLFAEGFLRASSGIELESSLLDIQISHSLGRGESGFIINSSVDGTLKVSHLADIQSGFMLQSEAEFVPRILARPIQGGIVISAAPMRGTLQKMTKGESSIIFSSEADAILSHSLGRMESGFVIKSNSPSMSKHSFFNGESGFVLDAAPLDTKCLNRFTVDNGILLTAELKNLCYLVCLDIDNGIVLDTEAAGTLVKVLYGAESGIILGTEASAATTKAIHVESGIVLDTEATGTPVKVMKPEESGVVIITESAADLKRYRLLEETDDMALEEMDDDTLEELDYVWLT